VFLLGQAHHQGKCTVEPESDSAKGYITLNSVIREGARVNGEAQQLQEHRATAAVAAKLSGGYLQKAAPGLQAVVSVSD
jgi:hypothetical protein